MSKCEYCKWWTSTEQGWGVCTVRGRIPAGTYDRTGQNGKVYKNVNWAFPSMKAADPGCKDHTDVDALSASHPRRTEGVGQEDEEPPFSL